MSDQQTGPAGGNSAAGKFTRSGFILDNSDRTIEQEYEMETKKLGQGTYGSVSKVVHKKSRLVRAVKTIPKTLVKNVNRFRTEIDIMKSLDHPHIVKLFEVFEDAKSIYLVLELCQGGELFDRIIDEGSFGEKQAALLAKQLLTAIFYMHSKKIMHRDLKPENLLFLSRSREAPLKLIDFGLSTRFYDGEIFYEKAGTPYYVSAQVLQGAYDYKTDIWSAAVIIYIMLCGYPPFHGESDTEILARVKSGKFSFPESEWSEISQDAKDLISKMLAYDPAERFTAEQCLNHRWLKALAPAAKPDSVSAKSLIPALRSFRAQTKLKKVALTVVASQVNEAEMDNLRKTFQALDANGDGTLTFAEIRGGMVAIGVKPPADLDALLADLDSDGSGVVDYTEFLAATIDRRLYLQEDVLWQAFRVFDLNGDGRITQAELRQVLNRGEITDVVSEAAIKNMVAEVDLDGDGDIDFDEFLAMMRKGSVLSSSALN